MLETKLNFTDHYTKEGLYMNFVCVWISIKSNYNQANLCTSFKASLFLGIIILCLTYFYKKNKPIKIKGYPKHTLSHPSRKNRGPYMRLAKSEV